MKRRDFLKLLGIGVGGLVVSTTFFSFPEILVPQNIELGTMEMMRRYYHEMLRRGERAIGVPKALRGQYIQALLDSDPLNKFYPNLGGELRANSLWRGTILTFNGAPVYTEDVMALYGRKCAT